MEQELGQLKNDILEIRRLTEENHTMLLSVQRRAKMSILFNIVKWTVIIGIAFGSLYFLKPYVDSLKESYSGIQNFFTK